MISRLVQEHSGFDLLLDQMPESTDSVAEPRLMALLNHHADVNISDGMVIANVSRD